MPLLTRVLLAAALAPLVPAAFAQQEIQTHYGEASGGWFGGAVAGAGDIDGDSVDDILVGAPLERVGGVRVGVVRAFSGADGRLILRLAGTSIDGDFGRALAIIGDTDGDSHDDIAVGIPGADRMALYSGADGSLLHTFVGVVGSTLGRSVANAGDVDGDGVDDIVIGAPQAGFGGSATSRVVIVSGVDGSALQVFSGTHPSDNFGASVDGIGDLDGDGRAELLVGAPGDNTMGARAGRADVISGATGITLLTVYGSTAGDELGGAVSGAADIDADGFRDLIAGAWGDDTGGNFAGAVHVWSGATGGLLLSLHGAAPVDLFGFSVSGIADLDGDGRDEVVVGVPGDDTQGAGAGSVAVFSGATGASLGVIFGTAAGDLAGYAVARAGNPVGAGVEILLFGAPGARRLGAEVGRTTQVLVRQLGSNYCSNGPNSSGAMGRVFATGSPVILDNDVTLVAYHLPLNAPGFFLVSADPGLIPSTGLNLCVTGNIGRYVNNVGLGPVISHGIDLAAIPVSPQVGTQPGDTWYFQCWHRDALTGSNLTDAMGITFQ